MNYELLMITTILEILSENFFFQKHILFHQIWGTESSLIKRSIMKYIHGK